MKRFVTTLALLSLTAVPAFAGPATQINGGWLSHDYAGSANGSFLASGSVVLSPVNEGAASATYELDGLQYLTVVAGLEDGTNFTDATVIITRAVSAPTAGTYTIDNVNTFCIFVDDATGYTVPTDLCAVNWTAELASIVAAGKYAGVSGSVTFNNVSASLVSGTFSTFAMDLGGGSVTISNGQFNIEDTTPVEASDWASVKAMHR